MGWADALQGGGAWLSGNGPQYMQAQAQQQAAQAEQEAQRQKAMLTDFVMAESMLKNGQVQPAIEMFRSRLEAGKKLPPVQSLGGSMGTSEHYLGLLESGNIDQAFKEISTGNQVLRDAGVLPNQQQTNKQFGAQETFADSKGNLFMGTMVNDPATGQSTPSVIAVDGSGVMPDGKLQLVNSIGLTAGQIPYQRGQEQSAIERARTDAAYFQELEKIRGGNAGRSGVGGGTSDADLATSANKSKLLVDRASTRLETGLTAASTLPSLYRMGELLDTVETGGFSNVTAKAQSMFGVLPKDKAELQNLMGRNVLSQLKASFGGNPSEREGQFLAEIEASLSKGTGANKATIDNAIKLLELRASNGKKAAKYLEDQDSADEIDNYMKLKLGDAPSNQGSAKVGSIIKVGGKSYRIVGGDPNDPDVELVQ